jgi:hypothetical protein
MQNKFEFNITFKLQVEAMNVADASLQMRKHVDEIHWMTGSDEFDIDLRTITNEKNELLYTNGIEFYPDGMNIILD